MPFSKLTLSATVGGRAQTIKALFNPSEIAMDHGAQFAEIPVPGLSQPVLQFIRGETQSLSFELFLDATKKSEGEGPLASTDEHIGPVVEKLRRFSRIDGEQHAPPIVEVSWGSEGPITTPGGAWKGVITQMRERFVLFDERGRALRARVTLTFKRYVPPAEQRRSINPQSPDRTKTRVVREGERIDQIAAAEYGDPTKWRLIAAYNQLERPRVLRPGTLLEIPAL